MSKREQKRELRARALAGLKSNQFWGQYSAGTVDRMAGTVANLIESGALSSGEEVVLAERGSDRRDESAAEDGDMLREVTAGPRGGARKTLFGGERLGELEAQRPNRDGVTWEQMKRMWRSAQVVLGLAAIEAPIIGTLSEVPEVISEDPMVRGFVRKMLTGFWRGLVRSSIRGGVPFGYQPHEKLWHREDFAWSWAAVENGHPVTRSAALSNAWILRRCKDIDPEGVKIWVDSKTDSYAGFTVKDAHNVPDIVWAKKSFIYTSGKMWGNLHGSPRLGPAYEPYYEYEVMKFFAGRYFERYGEPGVKIYFDPRPAMDQNAVKELYPGQKAIQAAEAYRGSGLFAMPSDRDDDGHLLNEFDLITDDKRAGEWTAVLDFHLKMVLRALVVPERVVTQGGETGSFKMSQTHLDVFLQTLQGEIENFIEHVNTYIVPQIVGLNLRDAAPAHLIAPDITKENQDILAQVVGHIMRKDPAGRQVVDLTRALLELNIPTREIEEPKPEAEFEQIELQAKKTPLDSKAEEFMTRVEAKLDKAEDSPKKKVFEAEKAMKKVASGFLKGAKLTDDGRLKKRGNVRALAAAQKKIAAIGVSLEQHFSSDDGERGGEYLEPFGEQAIADLEELADVYGEILPRGWKSRIRSEKELARSFGNALGSYLENVVRIVERTAPALGALLATAWDKQEVVDEELYNKALLAGAAQEALEEAEEEAEGKAKQAVVAIGALLKGIQEEAGADEGRWEDELEDAAEDTTKELDLDEADQDTLEEAVDDAVRAVSKVAMLKHKDTIVGKVEDYKTHRGYVDLTVESPARGAYRWTLWAAAKLFGWDLFKFYRGPKTEEVDGTPSGTSLEYDGVLGTTEWWDDQGRKRGTEDPLQLYMFHYGDRGYAYPVPRRWAEEQGLEWRKTG